MAKETTTVQSGRGKKFEQKHVNLMEHRLSQSGGTTLRELAADISLKCGEWNGMLAAAANDVKYTEVRSALIASDPDSLSGGKLQAKNIANREKRKAGEAKRAEENNYYLNNVVIPYILQTYGEIRREIIGEPNSRMVGYGDRIEVDKKAHLHKLW